MIREIGKGSVAMPAIWQTRRSNAIAGGGARLQRDT
jgi:hypothetical protein